MADQGYLLAIDGGQTSTKALLSRLDGTVISLGQGGPSDHFHSEGGEAKNRAAIQTALQSALSEAGVAEPNVRAIALGLTGAPTGGDQTPVVEQIVGEVLDTKTIVTVADYVTNLAGASAGEPGVVLIAGGGAIAYGVTATGESAIAGGFGYLLGDEGSAFDIGRRAIIAAIRASDGRDAPTILQAIVRSAFELDEMRQITRIVYRAGFARDRISRLAPLVAGAAHDGDAAALAILTTAGEELARTALAVIRRLFAGEAAVPVYLTGGVFGAGDLLLAPLRAELARGWPNATTRAPAFPPVVGALILARRALDLPVDHRWLATVARSLPRERR